MDYGKVLSRGWSITWRWKILWVLAFLSALGSGGPNWNPINYQFTDVDLRGWDWPGMWRWEWQEAWPAVVLGVLALALVIGLALWVVSIFAQGGLIAGVRQVEEEGSTSFRRAWRAGAPHFWSLLVVRLIFILGGFLLAALLFAAIVAIALATGVSVAHRAAPGVAGPLFAMLACCFIPLCCLVIPAAALVYLIMTYADRAIVLENKGAVQGLARAWEVFRRNVGPSLLLLLIYVGIGLGVGIAIGLVLLVIAVPVFLALFATEPALWWIAPIVGGGLVIAVLSALLNSIITAFVSAGWTLAYRQMAGLVPAAAVPPPPEVRSQG